MVDWENLEKTKSSPLVIIEWSTCPECGVRHMLFVSNPQLNENFKRLSCMRPKHPSFWYYFVKARKRAEQVQKRGNYGTI